MATTMTDRLGSTPSSPSYGNDQAAIEALTGTGMPERTAENVWALRALTGANSALSPAITDTFGLGTASLGWSDLFLATGGVINWNAGDVTITHSANALAFAGASSGYSFDAEMLPASNDGAALGDATHNFSDLFLASGAVVNWNNGDVTLTHSANALAFAGASNGYSFDAAVSGTTASFTGDVAAATLGGGPLGNFRNLLINPYGRVNQRAPATNADDTYGHDRWYALTQTNTIAVSTVSDAENGTPRMWRLTQSQASAQRMGYAQIIEGANCKHLRGKAVTLGGRIKFSLNAAVRYAILEWTGTEDAVTSDVVNSWTNGTFTAGQFFNSTTLTVTAVGTLTPAAATLTDLTALTTTLGSSFNNLIIFIWTEGTAAQNATLDGALQFEQGSVVTQREVRSITVEIEKCQRYYWKMGPSSYPYFTGYTSVNGQGITHNLPTPVTMRAAPTGAVGGTFTLAGGATGQPTINATSVDGIVLIGTTNGTGLATWSAAGSGYVTADAEL